MTKSSGQVGGHETTFAARPTAVDVQARWGGELLDRKVITRGTVRIGDIVGVAAIAPASGAHDAPFVELTRRGALLHVPVGATAERDATGEGDACGASAVAGPIALPLLCGQTFRLRSGDCVVSVAATADAAPAAPRRGRLTLGALGHVAVVALLHAVLLGSSAHAAAAAARIGDETPDVESLRAMLVASERSAAESDPTVTADFGDGKGTRTDDHDGDGRAGGGARARGEEGRVGSSLSRASNRRWAVPQHQDDLDPSLARRAAERDAATFGAIGLLTQDARVPASPFAAFAPSGLDASAANGAMWGDAIGDSFGIGGLALSGVGEGGGGRGSGIGLGDLGALGHTAGAPGGGTGGAGGIGIGGGGSGWGWSGDYSCGDIGIGIGRIGHGVGAITLRKAANDEPKKGKLIPEAIQRVVRANFGRFRGCYEPALVTNPALAGRVVTRFVVGEGGRVTSAEQGGSSMPDAAVGACVVRTFRSLAFPAPPDGTPVSVSYPIFFSPATDR